MDKKTLTIDIGMIVFILFGATAGIVTAKKLKSPEHSTMFNLGGAMFGAATGFILYKSVCDRVKGGTLLSYSQTETKVATPTT